jgi:FMN phosphatase YigB (HAD superfamily)
VRTPSGTRFSLLALDVFDTCLIRDFVSQESLWYLLGHEIVKQLPGVSSAAEFARLRGSAEDEARGQGTAEDVALNDVYARIAASRGWTPAQQRQAIALEEDLESRGLRPNPLARTLLAKAHGAPVSYLTDTPHRGEFIRRCLYEHSLPAGAVLSSGDLGLRKGTGSLFREAGRRHNVGRGQVLHIGNDLRSDAAGSARAGVPFALFADANPTRFETALDDATTKSAGLLGAVLAGCGRHLRLAKADQAPPALVSVVSGVAGPAVFTAAAWILLSAQRDGVDTLYFVARDGEILLAVAKLLQRELGMATEIECRYLYGSRRAWHFPALSLVDAPEVAAALRRLLFQSGKNTLRDLMSHLGLSDDGAVQIVAQELVDVSADTLLGERLTGVIDTLAASSSFQSLALSRARTEHEATVAYLRQEKMFSSSRPGLIDIGWHGAASSSLVKIAAAQGTSVLCYFAGGLCGQESAAAPEDSRAFLIDARGEEPETRQALVHLMESFCAGSGGSTLGYAETDGRWGPRLAPDQTNRAMAWGLRNFQELVWDYTTEVCRGLVKFAWNITLDELEALRPCLIANLCALWDSPTYAEAELWGSFPFEDDEGSPMLGRAVAPRDLARYIRYFRNAEMRPRFGPWRQAVVVRTIGSRRFNDPFGSLRMLASPQQRLNLRARVRSELALRPVIRITDVDVRDGVITVGRRSRTAPLTSSRRLSRRAVR